MTAEELAHLAELAALAARYFAGSDPLYARRFADAALAAVELGADQAAADSGSQDATPRLGGEPLEARARIVDAPELW